MHPLAIALAGMSGSSAVSSFCAMVTPPTSRISQSASAPSPSNPETMTAISLPCQCCAMERRKTVMTSGHPLGFEIGLRRNSPSSTCRSRCGGMMNTQLGLMCRPSVMSATGISV